MKSEKLGFMKSRLLLMRVFKRRVCMDAENLTLLYSLYHNNMVIN